MSRYLIDIRGCNGSGKSTIVCSMMDDPDVYFITKPYNNRPKKIATVFPNYGWVAIGPYSEKSGGVDVLPNSAIRTKALWYVLKNLPEYNVVLEGCMSSTTFTSYAELYREVKEKYPELNLVIVSLIPPLKTCFERILGRNGGKPFKEKYVKQKWEAVNRNIIKFRDAGFISIGWDNSGVKEKYPNRPLIKVMMKYVKGKITNDYTD